LHCIPSLYVIQIITPSVSFFMSGKNIALHASQKFGPDDNRIGIE
jgi:hypothetical protein